MANITRIKAKDPRKPKDEAPADDKPWNENELPPDEDGEDLEDEKLTKAEKRAAKKADRQDKKAEKRDKKASKKAKNSEKSKKPMPKWLKVITWPFRMILKPFIAFGRYLKASWGEIRQVRWPNRAATWKMVGAVLIYSALLITLIMLLDAFFSWAFNIIFNN